MDIIKEDKDAVFAKIDGLIDRPVDLVVLTELFSTSYAFEDKDKLMELAEDLSDSYTVREMTKLAIKKQCHFVGAIIEKESALLYITAIFIGPEGLIGKHRKRHLTTGEQRFYTPGDTSTVVDINGIKVGALVCFEGWFPGSARELMVQGAQIICHTMLTTQQKTLDIMRVRAIENKAYVVIANSFGTELFGDTPVKFRGDSRVIDHNGDILINAVQKEGLFITEIDPELTKTKAFDEGIDLIKEAKKHMYPIREVLSCSTLSGKVLETNNKTRL